MTTTCISLTIISEDSPYAEVYRVLQREYIGSWADASALYSEIRCSEIANDIHKLLTYTPSSGNKERAAKLLEQMAQETFSKTSEPVTHMAALVMAWAAPPSVKPRTVQSKNSKNEFSALADEDDD